MEWVVKGIDLKTAMPAERSVAAYSAHEAMWFAQGQGMQVSGVSAFGAGRSAMPRGAGSSARGPSFICPNPRCGYKGPSLQQNRGSDLVTFFLFACGIIPGLLYVILCRGTVYRCPKCRTIARL